MANTPDSQVFDDEIHPSSDSDSFRNRTSPTPEQNRLSQSGGSEFTYNIGGFTPQPNPVTPDENDEREALTADEEPHRGVKRDLGQWQIFVRTIISYERSFINTHPLSSL